MTETTPSKRGERVAYSFAEFADKFGKKRHWAYRMVAEGKVRAIDGYGLKMIPASEVERILDGVKAEKLNRKAVAK